MVVCVGFAETCTTAKMAVESGWVRGGGQPAGRDFEALRTTRTRKEDENIAGSGRIDLRIMSTMATSRILCLGQ